MKTPAPSNNKMIPGRRIGLYTKLTKKQSHYCFPVRCSHQSTCQDTTLSMSHLVTGEWCSDCAVTYWICSSFGLDLHDTNSTFSLSRAAPVTMGLVGLFCGHANLCDWTPVQMVCNLQKGTEVSALVCPAQVWATLSRKSREHIHFWRTPERDIQHTATLH